MKAGAGDQGKESEGGNPNIPAFMRAWIEKPSFRDTVAGEKKACRFSEKDDFAILHVNDGLLSVGETDSWPAIRTSQKLRDHLHTKWKDCLIVKLLGRNIGFNTLDEKLHRLWNPKGEFELIDLGEGYYVVKFREHEDYWFALSEGPWVIFGHYLTVCRWQPDFRPTKATIKSTAVWVRFPEIPVEYFNDRILLALGNTIGKALKVDHTTHFASRGRFARVCVEIVFNKPLVPRIELDGHWIRVEYEGIHLLCFDCGCVGHSRCAVKQKNASENGTGDKPENGAEAAGGKGWDGAAAIGIWTVDAGLIAASEAYW